ncbi:GNAT family N-acetyltransferase [Ruegeria sp. 2205SS24-7]|uniref:GNAT family N-acetyltransferase n=1 Tax=Ruegeria discodermiae TaxID=3064389 RepID=UPI00274098F4|nr:GNAT family N-acetyltransferase [Ruegeria sp. 2205SS24-7]MDP5220779.1 GNAT family N-acetyltransferase [Ruegeria sp. 2205SS24-7]
MAGGISDRKRQRNRRETRIGAGAERGDVAGYGANTEVALRTFCHSDQDVVFDALRSEELARCLAALPVPVDDAGCALYLRFLTDPNVTCRVVTLNGRFAGVLSLGTELTFWICSELHGAGICHQALRQFLALPEVRSGAGPLIACCLTDNNAAAAVLRKVGFVQVGQPFRRYSFAEAAPVLFQRYCRDCQIINLS